MISPTVAVVQTAPATITPVTEAFHEGFPEARPWHLLDDRLARDVDAAGGLTPALRRRMLIAHAVDGGAHAVQVGCSMYGPVARVASTPWEVPVLSSDEAMCQEVARRRPAHVGVLASPAPPPSTFVLRLTGVVGPATDVVPLPALDAADPAPRLAALTAAARAHVGEVDLFDDDIQP